jgi:hypothetical protein
MSTILFWLAVAVLALVLLSMIPGLDLLLKPLMKMHFDGLTVLLKGLFAWGIWFVKKVIRAHTTLMKHLVMSAEQLDPSVALEKKNKEIS